MQNRLILWIALGSLFLNIGVISAVGIVYWNNQRGDEPWQALEANYKFKIEYGKKSHKPIFCYLK